MTFTKNLYDIDLERWPKRLNLIEEKYMIFKSRQYMFDVLVVFFYRENALGVNEYLILSIGGSDVLFTRKESPPLLRVATYYLLGH